MPLYAFATDPIEVNGSEAGKRMEDKFSIYFNPGNDKTLSIIENAYDRGLFQPLKSSGSTGFQEGAVWSNFTLHNTSDRPITLHLEYPDHQLIELDVFERKPNDNAEFSQVAALALHKPFSHRPIVHNRFVFSVELAPLEQAEYFAKFSSDGKGYVFPDFRIWEPSALRDAQSIETGVSSFLFGGLLIMSVIALIGGIATGEKFFYAYSVYSISKIAAWGTILGYAHQYFLRDSFHWSYMSIAGAISIFCALIFARVFLQTRQHTPKLDYVILFMIANTVFLFIAGVFKLTSLAVMSITIALLLYPVLSVAGLVRWYQGSKEAALFAFAWSFLVAGLFVQALRDLGYVEHNFFNYYWPTIASYTEMIVIMAAMGVKIRGLRRQKDVAEHKYLHQLEGSKAELEELVTERTRDLEREKLKAELEACTDSLTGTRNRRSFFAESEKLLEERESSKLTFSLLMFDIDHFKDINDTYGHNIGDEALRNFADAIAQKIRDKDIFGRIGGEEFSLLLCANELEAVQMADRLRKDISELKINTPKGPLQFTTSVGVAHLHNETMIEELLNQADKALYEAKEKGRNQVVECSTES